MTRVCGFYWTFILCFLVAQSHRAQANEAILMDTRTATSDVGWMMSQGSAWQEVSSPHPDKSDRRMLMVCGIRNAHQDNWVRTPFIQVDGAKRIFVEFEFTIRSCEDVPNVATCKETFNLYYYETDRDEATTTFPPWREGAYIKVDTIAADKRFRPGSEETNFETREIGPLSKNGIYLALQDTGACMALMHVRVYYKFCSPSTQILANFGRTVAGPEMTSLVEVGGSCVSNAVTVPGQQQPSLFCNGKGEWTVPKGSCICTAGYDPDPDLTTCQACGRGQYKSEDGNLPCQRCPSYSHSRNYAATECECMYGYYRAPTDKPTMACTKTPSKPENLRAEVNQTNVKLTWNRPLHDGGRDDLTYRVECFQCQDDFQVCNPCPNSVDYEPSQNGLVSTTVAVQDLSAFAYYKFKVFSRNGVSSVATHAINAKNFATITAETSQAVPEAVLHLEVSDVTPSSFVISWTGPSAANGAIRQYEVTVIGKGIEEGASESIVKFTTKQMMQVTGLSEDTQYIIKVRAKTSAGFGPFSAAVKTSTLSYEITTADGDKNKPVPNTLHLIVAVIAGSLFVLIIIALVFFCKKRTHKFRSSKMDFEKFAMLPTNALRCNSVYPPSIHKTYIDPTTYEDPHRAVLDFTKEIDASYISIEEVIGGGEFGEVCRGRTGLPCGKGEQQVAIKTLKSGYSTQQKLDFLGEASIMGQFDHPNVIRLEGVVTKSRPHMIITEYMENGSLDAFLRKHDGEFTVIQLVGMLRNISAGMKYLSDMGYVHRDLAARNILVNAQLICKVSDFGMSRVLEEDSEAAYTARGGKIPIRWTAPEAFTFRKFTSASDVWSYGIVMWEVMSYGERPYWGMSNRDVMNAVETGYRLPAPMDCPQVQHRLMLDCWKKDRNQRPKFAQIVANLDKMLREPAQLKIKAGHERPRNGRIPNAHGRPTSALGQATPKPTDNAPASRTASPPPHSSSNGDSGYSNEETDEDVPFMTTTNEQLKADSVNVSSLGVWLDSIGLSHCKESFTRNGCTSLEQVLQLTHSDMERMGIDSTEDQDHLIETIQKISGQQEEHQDADQSRSASTMLPSYNESQRLTGISV